MLSLPIYHFHFTLKLYFNSFKINYTQLKSDGKLRKKISGTSNNNEIRVRFNKEMTPASTQNL